MLKHTLTAMSIGFLLFFLYLAYYTGAFKPVSLGIDTRGPYTFIYQEHTGAYHQIVSKIQTVESWAKNNNLTCRLSFGEYFDNPDWVEEGRLKSRGGCLIDPLIENEMSHLSKLNLPNDFKIITLEKTKAVVALFEGTPGIGPFKVYPKAEDFIKNGNLKKKGSVIEIYEVLDNRSMNTTYLWPIE